jgi:hypothetical protein
MSAVDPFSRLLRYSWKKERGAILLFCPGHYTVRGARWLRGQCVRRAIAEAKHRWSVIGWVIKNYYFELLRASEH